MIVARSVSASKEDTQTRRFFALHAIYLSIYLPIYLSIYLSIYIEPYDGNLKFSTVTRGQLGVRGLSPRP